MTIEGLTRHTDTGQVEFIVALKGKGLAWQSDGDGRSALHVTIAAATFAKNANILASKLETADVRMDTQDAGKLADSVMRISMRLRAPSKTKYVRVVVQSPEDGRLGALDLDRATIDAAPDVATPALKLKTRPPLVR
jgi:hypothetical protein